MTVGLKQFASMPSEQPDGMTLTSPMLSPSKIPSEYFHPNWKMR